MIKKIPVNELNYRMEKFRSEMNNSNPDWELAVIFSKINITISRAPCRMEF